MYNKKESFSHTLAQINDLGTDSHNRSQKETFA